MVSYVVTNGLSDKKKAVEKQVPLK